MKRNKIIIVALLTLFASEVTVAMKKSNLDMIDANVSPAGIPIGATYSMRKALEESNLGAAVTETVKGTAQKLETDFQTRVKEYETAKAAFAAKEATMTLDARKKEQLSLEKMERDLKELFGELQEELSKLQQEAVNSLIMEIVKIVEAMFADADFAILETDSGRITLGGAAQKKLDRTNQIIAGLNEVHAKQKTEQEKANKAKK